MRAGYWMVRCCRGCPEVAARIWLCNHEPGLPENKLDRPYLQGQIGLDLVRPEAVWGLVEFCEAPAEQQELFSRPLPLRIDVRAGLAMKPASAPMAKWKRERGRRITVEEFEAQTTWLRWAEKNAPFHPDFNYRRPVDPAAVPIPRFSTEDVVMDALTAEPINTLARPGIGHNNPPLAELLSDEIAADKARADELIAAAKESQIASDEDAAKCTTLVALIRNHEKKLDADREQRKRPFLESCRIVDAAYAAAIRPLSLARAGADGRGGLGAMLTAWQRKREAEAAAERARIEDERRRQEAEAERARQAAEAAKAEGNGSLSAELEALAAQERAADLARQAETIRPEPIRTSVGSATMRREIAFEIVDVRKALGWLLKTRGNEIAQAARTIVGKHLSSLGVDAVERGVEIPGVEARIDRRAQVR